MRRSTDRILVTHVGSLVRPVPLRELLSRRANGEEFDQETFDRVLADSVAEAVRMQVEAGVDVPSDGEFGKSGWTSYVLGRLSGLEPLPNEAYAERPVNPRTAGREGARFLDFYKAYQAVEAYDWHKCEDDDLKTTPVRPTDSGSFQCTGPIRYDDREIRRDIANFRAALGKVRVDEAFMPVAAPESARGLRRNQFFANDDDFLQAMADAMRDEYRVILDAGFLIQLDDAFLTHEYDRLLVTQPRKQVHRGFASYVEMLNYSLRDIPEEKVRYHVCWGSWNGPHTSDVPLRDIIDLVLKVRAQAYALESANPRHEHEYQLWEEVKLPDGKILIPGFVTHSTNVVEHPELVALRIKNFARLVGRENVIAGTDCGFSQSWNTVRVHPLIQWAKLASLSDGARLASKHLWR
jgi:5-methyltetrahydropteroyltriglutamate--homocysteine methyltransferase